MKVRSREVAQRYSGLLLQESCLQYHFLKVHLSSLSMNTPNLSTCPRLGQDGVVGPPTHREKKNGGYKKVTTTCASFSFAICCNSSGGNELSSKTPVLTGKTLWQSGHLALVVEWCELRCHSAQLVVDLKWRRTDQQRREND